MYNCALCDVNCRSAVELKQHERGKRHAEMERRAKLGASSSTSPSKRARLEPAGLARPRLLLLHPKINVIKVTGNEPGFVEAFSGPDVRNVDLILSDLPYFLDLDHWDNLAFCAPRAPSVKQFYQSVAQTAHRLLAAPGDRDPWAAFFVRDRDAPDLCAALRDAGFPFVSVLYWIKDVSYARSSTGFVNLVEHCVVACKSRRPRLFLRPEPSGAAAAAAGDDAPAPSNVMHFDALPPDQKLAVDGFGVEKCEKPVALLCYLLKMFAPESVVDLCAGSGSLASAVLAAERECPQLRQCVLFDKRQAFLEQAVRQRVERSTTP